MPSFRGSESEFIKFVGPRIRNVIQYKSKSMKKKLGSICQGCKKSHELHAAHIKGQDRLSIIRKVLKKYSKQGIVSGDLREIEEQIIKAHTPIAKFFYFLCEPCHKKYDKGKISIVHTNRSRDLCQRRR